MWEFEIRLRSVQDVQEFVAIATKRPYNVWVGNRNYRVNGKSFMEMFSLNFSEPLIAAVDCSEDEWESFRQEAARFLA